MVRELCISKVAVCIPVNSKNGKQNGHGTYSDHRGFKYVGTFKNSKYHGKGKVTDPDGSGYEGEWKNGIPDGQGTRTWSNGAKMCL